MDRESLDEFFARAEDVLTDWQGSTDAMHARAPAVEDVEALPGDSYYDQPSGPAWSPSWPQPSPRDVEAVRLAMAQIAEATCLAVDQVRAQMLAFGRAYFITEEARVLFAPPDTELPVDEPCERGYVADGWVRRRFLTTAESVPVTFFESGAPPSIDPRLERALAQRRTRNTGPADPVRLDGRRTRRATR